MEINLSNLLGADLNSAISLNSIKYQKFEDLGPVVIVKVNPVKLSMRDPRNFPESIKYWSEEFMNLVMYEATESSVLGVSDISNCEISGTVTEKPDKILYLPSGAYLVHNSGKVFGSGDISDDIRIANRYPYEEVKWIIKMEVLDELKESMKSDIQFKMSYFNNKKYRVITQDEILSMKFRKVNLNLNVDNIRSDCQLPLRYWNIKKIPIKIGKTDDRQFSPYSIRVLAMPLDGSEEFYMNIRYDGMINIYTTIQDSLKSNKKLSTGYITDDYNE